MKKKLLLFVLGALVAIGTSGAAGMPKFSGDFVNLLAVFGAVVTVWQIVGNAADKMQSELAGRDKLHDEQISKLWVKVEANSTAVDHHVNNYGHNGTIEELVRLKDRIAATEAVLAVHSQIGSIILRIEDLEQLRK